MQRQTKGFTLIELLVVIAIIAILAAILFPVFMNVKRNAKENTCIYNQKQLGMAILRYVDDNDGGFPYGGTNNIWPHKLLLPPRGQGGKYVSWVGCVSSYIANNKSVLFCPLWKGSDQCRNWPKTLDTSYWYFCAHTNGYVQQHPGCELCGHKISEVKVSSKKPCLTELNAPHCSDAECSKGIVGQTQVYCDGHATLIKGTWKDIWQLGYRSRDGIYHE